MGSITDRESLQRLNGLWATPVPNRCAVAPHPDLLNRMRTQLARVETGRSRLPFPVVAPQPRAPGMDDGLIIPGTYYPLGTTLERVRWAAAERAPLRGTIRVIVVLVDFSDAAMTQNAAHFNDLFFSVGVLPDGSVREYFRETSNGLVDLDGQVVGPFRLPRTVAQYAHGESGIGMTAPNARTMARDAVLAADPTVDFTPYDNDGNGFVDAFIVIHAGPGAEVTGNANQIWSHKWVLEGGERVADSTRIYAYLTVPEDARIGVCAHELGHLIFGWPDLYDTDNSSEGIGNWCLMGGGSWNGGGDIPAHPSAWCKANQGWVAVVNQTTNATLSIADVKDSHTVYRLWKDGAPGNEYFLLENRQRTRYDAKLPGDGLLIWHIDDATSDNTNEAHYKVALVQADGLRQLESAANRGDGGDPYPGSSGNAAFTNTSTPNSKAYSGMNSCVAVTAISPSGPIMTAQVNVRCLTKGGLGGKETLKERLKEQAKETRKEFFAENKRLFDKRPEKPIIDKAAAFDKPPITEGGRDRPGRWDRFGARQTPDVAAELADLQARVAALESLASGAAPFIGEELRPDLSQGAFLDEEDLEQYQRQMAEGDPEAKRAYDTKPADA